MKDIFLTAGFLCLITITALSQSETELYIKTYHRLAVEEMKQFGIPASITLAQGILESGNGGSHLAKSANNHFGIKCHTAWSGEKIYHDDDEKGECFREYGDAAESFRDHSLFLFHRERYSDLFKLDMMDYSNWAKGLKKAGYATNPKYAYLLIDLIERHNLGQYDIMGQEFIAGKDVFKDENEVKTTPVQTKGVEETVTRTASESYVEKDPADRVFILNRIKTIIATEDDNLLSIAQEYEVKLHRLRKYNEIAEEDDIDAGMHIFLQPKRRKGDQRYHVVKPGEGMYEIAQQHGMKVSELYEKNLMKTNDQAAASEILNLRKTRYESPKTLSYADFLREKRELDKGVEIAVNDVSSENKDEVKEVKPEKISDETQKSIAEIYYTVESGDTLYSIAKWFKTSIDKLKEWNYLQSNELSIGQVLIVGK